MEINIAEIKDRLGQTGVKFYENNRIRYVRGNYQRK